MSLIAAATLMVMGSGPIEVVASPAPSMDVGYEELVAGNDLAALAAIENSDLANDDPAKLINHGIALARLGQEDAARAKFAEAAALRDRYRLETAGGQWVDSRVLARRGLAMVDGQDFKDYAALASR